MQLLPPASGEAIKALRNKKKEKQKQNDASGQDNGTAISGDELEEVVFVLKADGTVERKIVTTGIQDILHIEIISGLSGGEKVITGPNNALKEDLKSGDKVRVVEKEKLFTK